MIQLMDPCIGTDEIDAAIECLRSGWIGKGPRVALLQEFFAELNGVSSDCVVATSCCTDALFLLAGLAGLGPDDEVILSSMSFVGVAQAVISVGATPVLIDVQLDSFNPTLELVAEAVTPKTKAVIVTHYGGNPIADIAEIAEFCSVNGLFLIEDAACSPLATIGGKCVGTFGDAGVFSFDAMKTFAAGDGGLTIFRDRSLAGKFKEVAYLGLPSNAISGLHQAQHARNWWRVDPVDCGRRSVMNDLSASLIIAQLKNRELKRQIRESIYEKYAAALSSDKVTCAQISTDVNATYYFFWVRLQERDALAHKLRTEGIYVSFRYWPIHKMTFFKDKSRCLSLSNTNEISRTALNLPLHANLTDDDVSRITLAVQEFLDCNRA